MTKPRIYICSLIASCVLFICTSACPSGCQCINEAPFFTSCVDRNFTEIPSDIPLHTEELYLKGNRIKSLSEGAFRDLVSLKRLVFTDNLLETLEANAFVGLTNLIHLDLRRNRLSLLPGYGFSGLASLKKLDLDDNEIQTIGEAAFIDLNLNKLGLENNRKLTSIHSDAFQDASVSNLFLFGSNLQSRSAEAFRNLRSSLQELYWMDNQQPVQLPTDLFRGFKFTSLKLDNNQIRDVSFLKHLAADDLSLVRNPIEPIDFSHYPHIRNVRKLHLDFTNFSHVSAALFRGLDQLETLHLQNNGITTVTEDMKLIFSKLSSLKLDNNPFHCNCELIWFKRWLTSSEFKGDLTGTQCSTPFIEELSNVDESNLQCTIPRVINIKNDVPVRQGTQMTLTCSAEGDPTPQILWELPDGRLKTYHPTYNRTETVVQKDFQKIAKVSDAGNYRCFAINLLGNDSLVTSVKVLPSPVSSSISITSLTYVQFAIFVLLSHLTSAFVSC